MKGGLSFTCPSLQSSSSLLISLSSCKYSSQVKKTTPRIRRIETLQNYAKKNNVNKAEDWYNIKLNDLNHSSTPSITRKQFLRTLQLIYPNYQWEVSFFQGINVPVGYWKLRENRLKYFEHIARHFQFNSSNDWFSLPIETINSFAPKLWSILKKFYQGSLFHALEDLFPHYQLFKLHSHNPQTTQPQKEIMLSNLNAFDHLPRKFWKSIDNQRLYFDAIELQLGIKEKDDWYKVSHQQLLSINSSRIYRLHSNLFEALRKVYPDHDWQFHLFHHFRRSPSFWQSRDHQRQFARFLIAKYQIQRQEDWYRLSSLQLKSLGSFSITSPNVLLKFLSTFYPEVVWNPLLFKQIKL